MKSQIYNFITIAMFIIITAHIAMAYDSYGAYSDEGSEIKGSVSTEEDLNISFTTNCLSRSNDKSLTEKWSEKGFKKPILAKIDIDCLYGSSTQKFTHQFPLSLIVFREAGWSLDIVMERMNKVATIYAQCGIKLGKVTIVVSDPINNSVESTGHAAKKDDQDYKVAKALPASADRPVLFYVRKSRDGVTAYAHPKFFTSSDSPLANTAWVTADLHLHPNLTTPPDRTYNEDAHELGHILGNAAHFPGRSKNLMASGDVERSNGYLTKAQCDKIKTHKLVKPL